MGSFYISGLPPGGLFFFFDEEKEIPEVSGQGFGVLLIPQGHIIVETGKDLRTSSSPMPLLQWDLVDLVAHDYVQFNF